MSWSPSSSSKIAFGATVVVASLIAVAMAAFFQYSRKKNGKKEISVAFLGNSIQYYNDCPRLIQQMLETSFDRVKQNSCLRGGASFTGLWNKGNGMQEKFATHPALQKDGTYDVGTATPKELLQERSWDYVVMNDFTQHPARTDTRNASKKILTKQYVPLLEKSKAIPILIQTMAYKIPGMRGTEDLGDFDQFTDKVAAGYEEYKELLQSQLSHQNCRIAPAGEAFRWLYHNHRALWEKLFSWDEFHPSPHGTWLEACVIYCTMTRQAPPFYNALWWEASRVMQPADQKPLPLPTEEEALQLRHVACIVCGLTDTPPAALEQ